LPTAQLAPIRVEHKVIEKIDQFSVPAGRNHDFRNLAYRSWTKIMTTVSDKKAGGKASSRELGHPHGTSTVNEASEGESHELDVPTDPFSKGVTPV
jgi:hypothetical protein